MTTAAYAIEPNDRWFYAEQDRLEMRDAQRENYEEGVITTLVEIGQSSARLARVERQARDEAMEACLDTIFSDADQQSRFEEALLQVWASHRTGEDSAEGRLAAVLDTALRSFAHDKAKKQYR